MDVRRLYRGRERPLPVLGEGFANRRGDDGPSQLV